MEMLPTVLSGNGETEVMASSTLTVHLILQLHCPSRPGGCLTWSVLTVAHFLRILSAAC